MRRVFPFAAPDDVPRARKARPKPAVRVADREAAGVIEVQVRREHDVDVLGREAGLGERVIEIAARDRAPKMSRNFVVRLVAEPGVDEHRPGAADDQRTHGQLDAIPVVGGIPFGPTAPSAPRRTSRRHRAGRTVAQRDQLEVAQTVCREICRLQIGDCQIGDWLLQLDQHAVGARRVDERDQRAFGAGPRLLVDQPRAAGLQLRQRRADVVDAQRDVVQARAALLDELRDRRIAAPSLPAVRASTPPTGMKCARTRCDGHLLRRLDLEPERVAIERQRRPRDRCTAMPM